MTYPYLFPVTANVKITEIGQSLTELQR